MNTEQNTKHAALATQVERQVEKTAGGLSGHYRGFIWIYGNYRGFIWIHGQYRGFIWFYG